MKLETPQIAWHGNQQRIMSIDFHPFFNILATGGSDENECEEDSEFQDDRGFIKISLNGNNEFSINFIRGLDGGHTKSVNCLRFSPNGQWLASCGDDNQIVIWNFRDKPKNIGSFEKVFSWCVQKVLQGHSREVYDLRWTSDSKYLISGGMDDRGIIWEVEKQRYLQVFDGHKSYVQGVCIDPKNKYIVTQGNDRQVRIWRQLKSKKNNALPSFIICNNLKRLEYLDKQNAQQKEENEQQQQQDDENDEDKSELAGLQQSYCCFLDEKQLFTFVKRPDWSPDGSFFLLPSAICQMKRESPQEMGVLIYRRCQVNKPSLFLSTNNKPAICTKFCPILFKKQNPNQFSLFDIPYVIVFAVATTDSVLIYSTSSLIPLAIVGNIHFSLLTDLAWLNSSILCVSSSDGYCSFIIIENNEFGEVLTKKEIEDIDQELASLIFKESYYTQETLKLILLKNYIPQLTQPQFSFNQQNNMEQETVQQKQETFITKTDSGQEKKKIQPIMIKKF